MTEPLPELIPTRHWMRPPPPPAPAPKRGWFWRTVGILFLLSLIPPGYVLALRWVPPPTSAFMLQSAVKPVQYDWVPARQISEHARKAVIASEDQKFWEHQGFDLEAIQKAYERNLRAEAKGKGRIRGGSTISQQTAKNLFLWSGGGYFRKGIEATFTILIEWMWGKERILEVYLNIAEFGPGIYGVEAAARNFFGKSAAQLTAAEAARLAAVLPNPKRWKAKSPGPYVQKRAAWILGQMGYRDPATPAAEPAEPPSEMAAGPENLEEMPAVMDAETLLEPAPSAPPASELPVPEPVLESEAPAASESAAPDQGVQR